MLWPLVWTVLLRRFWWGVTTYGFGEKKKEKIWLNTSSYLELLRMHFILQTSRQAGSFVSSLYYMDFFLASAKPACIPSIQQLIPLSEKRWAS